MEPRRDRSETEYEPVAGSPVAANPYRGTAPWQREGTGGWKRGLAGLGAVVLTAGSIAAVTWLAFREEGGAGEEAGDLIAERCTVTEAHDTGSGADPMEPGTPADRSLATVQTNYGEIVVMLWGDLAPCGVEAFTHLSQTAFYASHECDRLTTQAVDPTAILRCGSPGLVSAEDYDVPEEASEEEPEDATYGPGWRFQAETGMAGNDVADVLALVTDEKGEAGSAFALIRGEAVPTAGVSVIGGIVDGYEVLDQIAALTETVEYDGVPPVPVEIWGIVVGDMADLPSGPDTAGGPTPPAATTTPPGGIDSPAPSGTPTGTAPSATATPTGAATN